VILDGLQKRPKTEKFLFELCCKWVVQTDKKVEDLQRKNESKSNACTEQKPKNQADASKKTTAPRETELGDPECFPRKSQDDVLMICSSSTLF